MHSETILLVEDENSLRNVVKICLEHNGYTVLDADNGVDALAFLRDDPLDLPTCIFLDINMPMLDGFEVAEQATPLLQGKPATVLMMLTSSGAPGDQQRASEIPVIQGYVIKPLTADVVRAMLAGG